MTASYKISDLLINSESQLGKLLSQAQDFAALQQKFSSILSSDLIPHCRAGCYEAGILTLFTDSAAWATQLRYAVPELLTKLRALPAWAGLSSIQIKVHTSWQQTMVPPPPPPALESAAPLSEKNAAQLSALAQTLKDVPGKGTEALINSLERLAKHKK
jgi:hypothetical protein